MLQNWIVFSGSAGHQEEFPKKAKNIKKVRVKSSKKVQTESKVVTKSKAIAKIFHVLKNHYR
jgi:hypothetical protein